MVGVNLALGAGSRGCVQDHRDATGARSHADRSAGDHVPFTVAGHDAASHRPSIEDGLSPLIVRGVLVDEQHRDDDRGIHQPGSDGPKVLHRSRGEDRGATRRAVLAERRLDGDDVFLDEGSGPDSAEQIDHRRSAPLVRLVGQRDLGAQDSLLPDEGHVTGPPLGGVLCPAAGDHVVDDLVGSMCGGSHDALPGVRFFVSQPYITPSDFFLR